ncbi:MAG: hypothetical protein M3Z32_13715 [Acidobacteriota bacterium]|nr:hypothetical protein [Acidobacteriota bacterium]
MDCPLKAGQRSGEFYRQANEAILAYGAGAESSNDYSAFSTHLQHCSDCQRAALAQREVWSELEGWKPSPVPAGFDERLYARIQEYEQQPWWTRTWAGVSGKWSWKPAMPAAVACTVLIAAFLLHSPLANDRQAPHADTAAEARIDLLQVERALDDMDMLKQLGVASPATPHSGTL